MSKKDRGMVEGRKGEKKTKRQARHIDRGFRCRKHMKLSKLADKDRNLVE